MTLEEIKQWVYENRKGLIVGATVALLVRGLLR